MPIVVERALALPEAALELSHYLDMLAILAHPAAKPAVLRGMTSSSAAVRQAAAKAAGAIRLLESADHLGQLLGEQGVTRLRETAANGSALASEAAMKMLAENGLGHE